MYRRKYDKPFTALEKGFFSSKITYMSYLIIYRVLYTFEYNFRILIKVELFDHLSLKVIHSF